MTPPSAFVTHCPTYPAFEGTLAPGFGAHILGHVDTPAGGAVSVVMIAVHSGEVVNAPVQMDCSVWIPPT
jgi:hypothetical protein